MAVWAESNREVRVAFDHALDPLALRDLAAQVRIEYGEYVRAGDRFENLVPPYVVVQRQQMAPRFQLPVVGVSVTSDLRTMIISTAPMTTTACYAVTLPELAAPSGDAATRPRHAQTDVDFSLHGVHAQWRPADGAAALSWSGWLPHPELAVARQLLAGSSGHQPLWDALEQPGELTLTTQIDLQKILRPAVQPGATLDYQWPAEQCS